MNTPAEAVKMPRVYLAGKMGDRPGADVLSERAEAKALCDMAGLDYCDPAENENIAADKPVDICMDYTTMKGFVSKDEYAIKQCDVLLVLTGDTPSEGTGLEFGLALSLGKPVVLVSPKRVRGELMGFWNVKAHAIFATAEEAIDFIAENYGGVYATY